MGNEKLMDIVEFVNKGILQEANRQFFHPLGLALAVTMTTGDDALVVDMDIIDGRDDPAGFIFDEGVLDVAKLASFAWFSGVRHAYREKELGFVVQPVPYQAFWEAVEADPDMTEEDKQYWRDILDKENL